MHVGLGGSSPQVTPRLSSCRVMVLLRIIVHPHLLLLQLLLLLRAVPVLLPGGLTGGQGLQTDVGPAVLTAVQTGGHHCLSSSPL